MPVKIKPYWKRSGNSERWRLWYRITIKNQGYKTQVNDYSTNTTIQYRPYLELYMPGKYTANVRTTKLKRTLMLDPYKEIWTPKYNAEKSKKQGAIWKKKIINALKKQYGDDYDG